MPKLTTINSQPTTMPQHIGIIMDGNRRWARERGLPVLAGHKHVTDEVLEPLIEYAAKLGVKYMTFWAFSTENWNREPSEVSGIMRLFRVTIKQRWDRLHKKGVRVMVIGDLHRFPSDIQKSLRDVVEQTKNNTTITAIFALNYGGRDEILRGIQRMICDPSFSTHNSQLTTHNFSQYLDTAGIPDPEMVVRPGGEKRLSGFLLWQIQYSELFFCDWYMPDFTPEKLDELFLEYQKRSRRFGK